jgi:hypothetical protein
MLDIFFLPFCFCCWVRDPEWEKIRIRYKHPGLQHRVPHKAVLKQSFGNKIMLTLKLDKIPFR